jgi:Tannase and feruloyl esterase
MQDCLSVHQEGTNLTTKQFRRNAMQLRTYTLPAALLLASLAASQAVAALPSCSQLATDPTYGLSGNPQIVVGTLTSTIIPAAPAVPPNPPSQPTATPPTPAYCQVSFTYSTGLAGPTDGYDVGQMQSIKIRISLPLSLADGGAGAAQGNWIGKNMISASAGSSGSVTSWANFAEGLNHDTGPVYAIRLGYVGSSTDTGQGNPPFGVIQTGPLAHTLALGTIADWAYRGTHYGKLWGLTLAQTYYGAGPTRSYYNGCSGGGNEGMGQLQNYGNEYDGFLIAAPAYYWQQFRLADSYPYLVVKAKLTPLGKSLSSGQISAANTSAIAACDRERLDKVGDGIIADPRSCTFSAAANVCGNPNAPSPPNCLDPDQAAAIDQIWDGPRNHLGLRIWYPYDRGINFSTNLSGSTIQVVQWNHKDLAFDVASNLFLDSAARFAAGSPPNGITYEEEAALGSNTTTDYTDNQNPKLDLAKNHNVKVIQLHGMEDGAIRWRHDIDYYHRVNAYFGGNPFDFSSLQQWYRFFPMPGVGHCTGGLGGGAGPSVVDPFLALVNWVETGVAPATLLAQGGAGAPATRTRPLCPFPSTAVYKGSGSTDDASNFVCTGSLESKYTICNDVRTKYKGETGASLDYAGIGLDPAFCQ